MHDLSGPSLHRPHPHRRAGMGAIPHVPSLPPPHICLMELFFPCVKVQFLSNEQKVRRVHPENPTSIYRALCFYSFSVRPAECINGRAKPSSGKCESQELTNRLDTCLREELLKPEIVFVTEVHLLHRFFNSDILPSRAKAEKAASFAERSL